MFRFGLTYGSFSSPVTMGSGGGGTVWATGANGGGALHLIADTITVNGIISVNGDNPLTNTYQPSGGSAGSVSSNHNEK